MRTGLAKIRLRLAKIKGRLCAARTKGQARRAVSLVLFAAACAGVAVACGWDGWERSVRFNFSSGDRERERLPPLPFTVGGARGAEGEARANQRGGTEENFYASEQEESEVGALWRRADEAAARGELERARTLLREFAERAGAGTLRNSAVDRLDAFSALDKGAGAGGVRAYLEARRAYDLWLEGPATASAKSDGGAQTDGAGDGASVENVQGAGGEGGEAAPAVVSAETVRAALDAVQRERELEDNVAYLRAAVLFREEKYDEAEGAFAALAARHPRSEKRAAALLMAGRVSMSRSSAYAGPGATATSEDACPDCRDAAWTKASDYFMRVLGEHPRSPLAGDARGWLAYLSLRVGDRAGALAEYYRMLSDETDDGARREALRSLRLVRGRADEADMGRVEALLSDEPRAALAYAYHDIHNYTFSYYFSAPDLVRWYPYDDCGSCIPERQRWQEQHADGIRERAERRNLARVARFVTRMMNRHPNTEAGASFTLRLAQADLELEENGAALVLARRALARSAAGRERAGALWVAAVAEHRLRDFKAARRTLAQLIREFPEGDLTERARRLLAMMAEADGDLDAALEQYLALRYDSDVGYFVDVLLTPEQLAAFVERRPSIERRDYLLYALGVRYLRAGRYDDARSTLRKVRTVTARPDYFDNFYDPDDEKPRDPKAHSRVSLEDTWYGFEEGVGPQAARGSGVYAGWVLRDLKTADDLARLEREIESAADDEAKAEALYQQASYFYEAGGLVFYNPAAWRGMRAEMLATLNETNYRSPGEAETIWRHAREHEALSRALALYLEVVRRFPRTRAARDALYTSILCHRRLSNFNAYWRGAYEDGLHAGERLVTLAELRRTYPGYRLPFDGHWEPSTRTVGGGPAWTERPRPKPLTGMERARLRLRTFERRLAQGWQLFGEAGGGRVRRWLLAALAALVAFAVFRATRRTRRALFELLARCSERRRAERGEQAYAPRSSYMAHLPYTTAGRAREFSRAWGRELWRLVLDERGRAALVVNLVTHAALTALLWVMLRMLRGG